MKTKIICLCGSLRFKESFGAIELMYVLKGYIVLTPCLMYVDIQRDKSFAKYKETVDELHLRKIDLADEIYVINENGYVGESTTKEIEYAHSMGKKIIFMEQPNQQTQGEPMNTDKLKEIQTLDGILDAHIDFNESDYILINPKSELKDDLEVFIKQQVQLGRDEVISEIDTCITEAFETANDGADIIRAVNLKLTQLKEQK